MKLEERRKCVQIPVPEEDGNGIEYFKIPNYVCEDFMSQNERDFFFKLVNVVRKMKEKNSKYGFLNISSQVAANRLIRVNNERIEKFSNDIWAKSVDFVIYDVNNNNVICIIEVDTSQHNNLIDTANRDFALYKAFKNCCIPYVRIPALPNKNYTEKYITNYLKQYNVIDWEWES